MKTIRFRIIRTVAYYSLVIFASVLICGSAFAPPLNPSPKIANPQVLGISPMTFLSFSNLAVGESYQLQKTFAWYWTNLSVGFPATNTVYTQLVTGAVQSADYRLAQNPVPSQAFAVAQVLNGSVVGATITDGGSGYVTAPTVLIVRGGGTNATATTSISSSGIVTNIIITSNGAGYTNTPAIHIGQPPAIAISPSIQAVMRLNVANSAIGWRFQFTPKMGSAWQTDSPITNIQTDMFITNDSGFFRLIYP
jgi:hypothetical protein